MTYHEDSWEYLYFHHYYNGDYVVYNGRLYQWTSGIPHNPNTITAYDPDEGKAWKKASFPPGVSKLEDLWFRNKVYLQGQVVVYRGFRYRCLVEGTSSRGPGRLMPGDIGNPFWERLGPVVTP